MPVLKHPGNGVAPKTIIWHQGYCSAALAAVCDTLPNPWLAASLLLLGSMQALADKPTPSEYEVKAAFIYNMAKFVSWPESRAASMERLTLCILGNDPFGSALDAIRGKRLDNKVWEIRYMRGADSLQDCQVLFVAASEAVRFDEILARVDGNAILTVGDSEGFAARGGIINFFIQEGSVRFEINIDAVRRANLTISSQLLKLAKIVREGSGND